MKARAAAVAGLVLVVAAARLAGAAAANLVANGGFEAPGFKGWQRAPLGDGKGTFELAKDAHTGQWAARLHAPNPRSWTFVRQSGFPVAVGEGLVLTAWVRSTSARAKAVLTCGYVWGGNPADHTTVHASHSGSGQWQLLRAAITVHELPVSIAIGFDYHSEGQTLLVDDVRLERETDVLARDAVALATRYDGLAARGDAPEWVRAAAAAHASDGRTVAGELAKSWHDPERVRRDKAGWQRYVSRLRRYVEAGTQLIVLSEPGDRRGLGVQRIRLHARRKRPATATLTLLNVFGSHSVAVRLRVLGFAEAVSLRQLAGVGDPVGVRLGEASHVLVARGEPCRVGLTILPRRLALRTYKGSLVVEPLDRLEAGAPRTIPVELTVAE